MTTSKEEVKSIQALVEKTLNDANIPALSMSWHQANTNKKFAAGVTDRLNPKPVDPTTLFQASSLSKPVSAAMVLDLAEQNQWDLNTPLADISDYGPPELKADPRYGKLTIRMVIGQCSGLPNWVDSKGEKKFIDTPGGQFNYSGLAFDFLKEVIEKKTQKKWETLAQEFFAKVGMQNSTFKPLSASHLHDKHDVAQGHKADGTPVPPVPIDSPEIPAGSLLTTANDYMIFLQYCFNNDFLRSTLLTGTYKLNKDFPKAPFAASQIQWGLGMGIYTDKEKTIAFHWGNNTGWNSFCAINMKTGDAVVCFVNSDNGNGIQQVVEPVVGEMAPLFHWMSSYCNFEAEKGPKTPDSITALFPLMNALTEKGLLPSESTSRIFRALAKESGSSTSQLIDQNVASPQQDVSETKDKQSQGVFKLSIPAEEPSKPDEKEKHEESRLGPPNTPKM